MTDQAIYRAEYKNIIIHSSWGLFDDAGWKIIPVVFHAPEMLQVEIDFARRAPMSEYPSGAFYLHIQERLLEMRMAVCGAILGVNTPNKWKVY